MKTTPPAHLANVVNASITIFFHSVQPTLRPRPPAPRLSAGRRLARAPCSTRSGAARRLEAVSNRDDLTDVNSDPPVDLVHLARQCLGDCELEDELLRLFRLQAQTLTAQLSDPSHLSLESKAKIAHKLRGSALAVGARRVAGAALRIEELAAERRRPAPTGHRRPRRRSARAPSAPVRSDRGRRRNRPHSGLDGSTTVT